MPVFRVNRNANYTTMSNYHLRDKSLSFKAKGLLSMFLSLPDSWHYSVNGIAAISKESRASVMSGLRELEAAGYLVRHQHRDSSGRMKDIEYFITEIPQKPPEYENSTADNPTAELPTTVLPISETLPGISKELIKKEISNTDYINNGRDRDFPTAFGKYKNVFLSRGDLYALQQEYPHDYQDRIERLSEYMASTGKVYGNHLATIRSWARRDGYSQSMYAYQGNDSL